MMCRQMMDSIESHFENHALNQNAIDELRRECSDLQSSLRTSGDIIHQLQAQVYKLSVLFYQ